jgi:hypothetical protein
MSVPASPTSGVASTIESGHLTACLDRIDSEQLRFLVAFQEAQRIVSGSDSRLERVVAEQFRLLRRLLDAQRAVVRRCAETDRAVEELAATASFNVRQIEESAKIGCQALATGSDVEMSALTCLRPVEADALVERLHDQLERSRSAIDAHRSDCSTIERWTQLIDETWQEHNEQCLADLTTARADGDILVHDARVAARDALADARRRANTPEERVFARPSVLAAPVLDALDRAEDDSLEDFIDGLLLELHGSDPSQTLSTGGSGESLAAVLDAGPTYLEVDGRLVEDEAFRRFWALAGTRRPRRNPRPIRTMRNWVPSVGVLVGAVAWLVR